MSGVGSAARLCALVAASTLQGCEATQPPGGVLTLVGCEIAAADSRCSASVSWVTSDARSPRLEVGGETLSTSSQGALGLELEPGTVEVTLFDGATALDSGRVGAACASAAGWDGAACSPFATRVELRAPTPFTEGGEPVTLEVVLFRPPAAGPFPAVVVHHGSTGDGDDPTLFGITWVNETVARFFVERGWLVAFPQRRGRGASDGLYDEGFTLDRSRYACTRDLALAGFERALDDAAVAVEFVADLADVDETKVLVAGVSRGGVLAVAQSGRELDVFSGALNFVGGWLGEGCVDAVPVNREAFSAPPVFSGPTLWIYAEDDPFYSIAHSRANFDAFEAAGGHGTFEVYRRAPGLNGHFIANDSTLWRAAVDAFLTGGVR